MNTVIFLHVITAIMTTTIMLGIKSKPKYNTYQTQYTKVIGNVLSSERWNETNTETNAGNVAAWKGMESRKIKHKKH